MYPLFLTTILLILASCGTIPSEVGSITSAAELQEQVDRISSTWVTCEEVPAHPKPNTVTALPECDTGDSVLWGALLASTRPTLELCAGIEASVDEEGRPYRSKQHKEGLDSIDSFSRDHYLGLAIYGVSCPNPQELLLRVHNYLERNDFQACPTSSDGRCYVGLPSSVLHMAWTFQYLGIPLPSPRYRSAMAVSIPDSFVSLATVLSNPPGSSDIHLAVVKIYHAYLTNNLNSLHQTIIREALNKDSENLFYQVMAYLTGEAPLHTSTTRQLQEAMVNWSRPQTDSWWRWKENSASIRPSMGHDLVFLSCLLLRKDC